MYQPSPDYLPEPLLRYIGRHPQPVEAARAVAIILNAAAPITVTRAEPERQDDA